MNYLQKTLLFIILFISAQLVSAQNITVTGVVIGADDSYPLPGVNVVVQGVSGQGTITDFDGKFSISVPQGKSLVFKYVGYKDKVVQIRSAAPLNVVLESDALLLDEVVAIGYGTMKKVTLQVR